VVVVVGGGWEGEVGLGGRAEAICGLHAAQFLRRSGSTLLLDLLSSERGRGCALERCLDIAGKAAVGLCETASEIVGRTQRSNGGRGEEGREGNSSKMHGEGSTGKGNMMSLLMSARWAVTSWQSQLQKTSAAYQQRGGGESRGREDGGKWGRARASRYLGAAGVRPSLSDHSQDMFQDPP
jgi:hypothetical protein